MAAPGSGYVTLPGSFYVALTARFSHLLLKPSPPPRNPNLPHPSTHACKSLTAYMLSRSMLIDPFHRLLILRYTHTPRYIMKTSLSSVLLLALATESTVASSWFGGGWFGGASKAGQYSFRFYRPSIITLPKNASTLCDDHTSVHVLIHVHAFLLVYWSDLRL